MKCSEFKKIINEYIDGELSVQETENANKHIEKCANCREVVKVYRSLSGAVKFCNDEKIPDNFSVDFPEKKNNVVKFFRKHQSVLASLVAAIALVIFAEGIETERYIPKSVDTTKKVETTISVPTKNENAENTKTVTNKTPDKNSDVIEDNLIIERSSTSYDVEEEVVPKEPEVAKADVIADEQAISEENADVEVTEGENETETIALMRIMPDASNEDDTPAYNSDEIFSYIIPSPDEFENEEMYYDFEARLSEIRSRAENGVDEKLYNEYKTLVEEIEKAIVADR